MRHFFFDHIYAAWALLDFYAKKYPQASVWNVEKSLSYFEDAESEAVPRDLKGRGWIQIKDGILKANRLN